jgi:hypothetical protein
MRARLKTRRFFLDSIAVEKNSYLHHVRQNIIYSLYVKVKEHSIEDIKIPVLFVDRLPMWRLKSCAQW